jgi:hypothetical protein
MGQGVNAKIIAVVARTLGVDAGRVAIETTNTLRVANTSPTAASSGADMNGRAAELACRAIAERLRAVAAGLLGVAAERVGIAGDRVLRDGEAVELPWERLVWEAYTRRVSLSAQAHYATPAIHYDRAREQGEPFAYHVYGTAMVEVTVVEGSDAAAVGATFAAHGIGTVEHWQRLLGRVEWVEEAVVDAPSLEGFLFPDTYRFAVGIAAETAARHLAERFVAVWREEAAAAAPLWGSPLEVVTLASLVEAETSREAERALIAGVFVNRLRLGMPLQCDPTVVYALKRRGDWRGRLLRTHWDVDDPYNTYRHRGLPPGPINSPGRAALRAACAPAASPYLYFVARPEGGHAFSTTLAEHNRAVARLRAARR